MDADERLRALWQGQRLPAVPTAQLLAGVQRHRRRLLVQRVCEATLSLAAVGWFVHAFLSRQFAAVEWLLLPYFSVFLVVAWSFNLRHAQSPGAATESARVYAGLRLVQLRNRLRELQLARRSAQWLLGYALATLIAALLWGTPDWRTATLSLALTAVFWLIGCEWVVRHGRRRCRREYRALRRLR
jgi:hypothetical protein